MAIAVSGVHCRQACIVILAKERDFFDGERVKERVTETHTHTYIHTYIYICYNGNALIANAEQERPDVAKGKFRGKSASLEETPRSKHENEAVSELDVLLVACLV